MFEVYLDNNKFHTMTNSIQPDILYFSDKYDVKSKKKNDLEIYIQGKGKYKIYYVNDVDVKRLDQQNVYYKSAKLTLKQKCKLVETKNNILVIGAVFTDKMPTRLRQIYYDSIIWTLSNSDSISNKLDTGFFSIDVDIRKYNEYHIFNGFKFDKIIYDYGVMWFFMKHLLIKYNTTKITLLFVRQILKPKGILYIPYYQSELKFDLKYHVFFYILFGDYDEHPHQIMFIKQNTKTSENSYLHSRGLNFNNFKIKYIINGKNYDTQPKITDEYVIHVYLKMTKTGLIKIQDIEKQISERAFNPADDSIFE